MADKTLKTRIISKNATYEEWKSSSLVLKKGEIALAQVTTAVTDETTGKILYVPRYLMKVGDGSSTFANLQWLAAPASDVYAWAKKEKLEYADMPDEVKAISDNASAAIKAAIEALDKSDSAVANQFVTAVSETDGIISVTRRSLAADDIPTLAISKIDGLQDSLDGITSSVSQEVADRTAADTALEGKITTLEGKIGNLTNIMNFRGAVTAKTAITDPAEGDVIVVTAGDDAGKEFIYSGGAWVELGYADANTQAISGLTSRMEAAEGNITTLMGADTVEGSVAKALKDAKAYTDTKTAAVVGSSADASTANTVYGAKKYADAAVKALEDGQVATLQSDLEALTAEVGKKALATDLTAATSRIAALETTVNTATTGLKDRVTAVESVASTNKSDISTLKTNKADVSTVSALDAKVQTGTFISTGNQFVDYDGNEIVLDCGGAS